MQALLRARGHAVELLGMTTQGDRILDRTLSKVGGKGLFVKELEVALEEGRAHVAVHSLKDVPMELPEGFELACVMEREDPRDAFVSPRHACLADLPQGAVVGTSSLRRQVLLQALRPDLVIQPLRGNPRHPPAQARRRPVRRHRAGGRGPSSAWAWKAASAPCSSPTKCCRPPARARWAWRCDPNAMTCCRRWHRSPTRPPGSAWPPSAP